MYLHVCNQGAAISIKDNQFIIKNRMDIHGVFPIHIVVMIEIFGNVEITTQASYRCLLEHIPVVCYSFKGFLKGNLMVPGFINPIKVSKQ